MPDSKISRCHDDSVSTGNTKEKVVSNETGRVVTNETKTSGGKRSGVSYDTGVSSGKDARYKTVKTEILAGKLRPSVTQLRKQWQCNYPTAAGYLATMEQEGHLIKDGTTNQYTLRSHHGQ